MNRWILHPAAKPLLWLVLAAPAALLLAGALANTLGPNPAEALIRSLGDWTLRLLCLTLAITPLRQITGWHALLRWRRNLGVATFIYGSLHWLAYAWLDQGLEPAALWADVLKRPFILVGTAAWLAMLPLAATSFNRAIKAMGGRAWKDLHKVIYGVAITALLHFLWMRSAKNNYGEVAIYGLIIAVLLAWRWQQSRRSPSMPTGGR